MATSKRCKSDLGWADLLREAISSGAEKVPDGWLTRPQIRQQQKVSKTKLQRLLKVLMKSGKIEQRRFLIADKMGRVTPIPHYRIK